MKGLVLFVLALVGCGHQQAYRDLVALKVSAALYDTALGGAYVERARIELERVRSRGGDLGDYFALMDSMNQQVDRMYGLVTLLNAAAHNAAVKILNGEPGDHLVEVRRIVCEMARIAEAVVHVHVPGPYLQKCPP